MDELSWKERMSRRAYKLDPWTEHGLAVDNLIADLREVTVRVLGPIVDKLDQTLRKVPWLR